MIQYLNSTITFWCQTSQFSTGANYDAAAVPSYRIYEGGTTLPVATGNMALQDDTNTTGLYSASVALTAANGFSVGKSYCIRVTATVDGVTAAHVVDQFMLRNLPIEDVDPGDTAGRATNLSMMIAQTWRRWFNKRCEDGALLKVYKDDDATVLVSGAVTTEGYVTTGDKLS